MKVQDLIQTCQNNIWSISIYYDEEDWDDNEPVYTVQRESSIDAEDMRSEVYMWMIDIKARSMHILIA